MPAICQCFLVEECWFTTWPWNLVIWLFVRRLGTPFNMIPTNIVFIIGDKNMNRTKYLVFDLWSLWKYNSDDFFYFYTPKLSHRHSIRVGDFISQQTSLYSNQHMVWNKPHSLEPNPTANNTTWTENQHPKRHKILEQLPYGL